MRASLWLLAALLALPGLAAVASEPQAASTQPRVIQYHVTMDDVKYVYGVASPVARLRPGDILETNTVDAFGNALQKPGDTFSMVKGDNPLTGPFYVEGAEPGDTLVVKILHIEVDSDQGVGALAPGRTSKSAFGANEAICGLTNPSPDSPQSGFDGKATKVPPICAFWKRAWGENRECRLAGGGGSLERTLLWAGFPPVYRECCGEMPRPWRAILRIKRLHKRIPAII